MMKKIKLPLLNEVEKRTAFEEIFKDKNTVSLSEYYAAVYNDTFYSEMNDNIMNINLMFYEIIFYVLHHVTLDNIYIYYV